MVETLAGINDLDILVSEDNLDSFLEILMKLGFCRGITHNEAWFPGISNYYGYDSKSSRLVHIHLHTKLIIGFDRIKNYHLPIEKAFISFSAPNPEGLRIPCCELELIMLVIRMVLKRRLLSLLVGHPAFWVKAVLGKGRGPLNISERNELEDLQARSYQDKLQQILRKVFPFVNLKLFDECLKSVIEPLDGYKWLTAGRKLDHALKAFRCRSPILSGFISAKRSLIAIAQAKFRRLGLMHLRKIRPAHGGRVIAFVGGDGAGKTTNINEMKRSFGKNFDVRILHIGKPLQGFLKRMLAYFSRILRLLPGKHGANLSMALTYWTIARGRYLTFKKALSLRAKGCIVCLDRFPLPGIMMMDTSFIRTQISDSGIYTLLARMEEEYHARIKGVDDLIILRLDPEIAIQRRPEADPEFLRKRSREIWDRKYNVEHAFEVDSSQPLEEVISQIRQRVWDIIRIQPRFVEIIGVAGTGKTTVTQRLKKRAANLRVDFPFSEFKRLYYLNLFRMLPMLICLKLRGASVDKLRKMLKLETILTFLQDPERKNILAYQGFVFDQGPIYQVSNFRYILRSVPVNAQFEEWLKSMEMRTLSLIDAVVWLDASNDVLTERINSRDKDHPVKNKRREEIDRFLDYHRNIFHNILESKQAQSMIVKHFDTGKKTTDEVVIEILLLL